MAEPRCRCHRQSRFSPVIVRQARVKPRSRVVDTHSNEAVCVKNRQLVKLHVFSEVLTSDGAGRSTAMNTYMTGNGIENVSKKS